MSQEIPLSRTRLHEILSRFEPGVSLETVGGYDTGVYFVFKGKALARIDPDDRLVGGRLINASGFCSEALMMTRGEQFYRGNSSEGIRLFFERCGQRQAQFARWLSQFPNDMTKEHAS